MMERDIGGILRQRRNPHYFVLMILSQKVGLKKVAGLFSRKQKRNLTALPPSSTRRQNHVYKMVERDIEGIIRQRRNPHYFVLMILSKKVGLKKLQVSFRGSGKETRPLFCAHQREDKIMFTK